MKLIRNFAVVVTISVIFIPPAIHAKPTTEQMHDALCSFDLEKVKSYVRQGFGVNEKLNPEDGAKSIYPLTLASYCYGGKPETAKWLIENGANVNLHGKGEYSNLMWALRSVDEIGDSMHEVVWMMIRKGANVNVVDDTTGRTALMMAASNGDLKLVQELIRRGASKRPKTKGDWCISDNYSVRCDAADYARLGGHVEVAYYLEGKNPATYHNTLHYAVKSGNLSLVKKLIRNGADVNEKEKLSELTPLHYAIKADNEDILEALLEAGAKPNTQDYAGVTPLRDAIVYYKADLARILIDAGARGDSEQKQGCGGGMTEFGWAVSYRVFDIAKYLIEKNQIDLQGGWKVFREIDGRNEETVEIAEILLERGAVPPSDYTQFLDKWYKEYDFEYAPEIAKLVQEYRDKPVTVTDNTGDGDNEVVPPMPALDLDSIVLNQSQARSVMQAKSRSMKERKQQKKAVEKGRVYFDKNNKLSPASLDY